MYLSEYLFVMDSVKRMVERKERIKRIVEEEEELLKALE